MPAFKEAGGLLPTDEEVWPSARVAADPAAVRRLKVQRRLAFLRPRWWLPFGVLLVVLGLLWNLGAERMPYLLPPLGDVARVLTDQPGYFVENAFTTLTEAVLGLVIGFVVASLLAVAVSEFKVARRAVMPLAVVLNVTPLVAIAPVLVVAFGFGMAPKLVLTSLICFFPILINTAVGLRSVSRQTLQVFASIDASRWEVLRHVRVPSALPFVFAALQIVFPLSIIGAVVAELSAAGSAAGLGTVITVASSMNRLATVWAAILVLAAMGALMLLVITLLERKVLFWREPDEW